MANSPIGIVAEAASTFAANSVVQTTDALNMRKGAGSSYDIIRTLDKGTKLTVLKKNSNSWVQVETADGKTGYVSADYLKAAKESLVKYTTTDDLNYRSAPSTTGTLKGTLKKGAAVNVVDGYSRTANGVIWFKVKIGSDYYYASSEYLKKSGSAASDTLAKVTGFKADTTMNAVKLSWNKVSGADGYWVYRAKPEGGWTKIKTTSSLSYTDGSREPATEYKYAVKAYKKVNGKEIYGEYPTLTVATRPAKLTGLTVSSITANTAALKWNAVKGASGYYVYYRKSGDSEWIRKDITKTSHTFSGLNGGTKYEFAAKAYKTAGGVKYVGDYPTVSATTTDGLAKVTGFKADTTMNAVKLSWNKVDGADGYWVYRGKPEGGWTKIKTTSSLSYTDGDRESGTEYKYAVKAYKKVDGKEIYGEYPTLATATRPVSVTDLKLKSISASSAAIEWDAVKEADGYYVYYRKAGDSSWTRTDITKTTYTFSELKPETKYNFAVKAYKTAGGVKYVSNEASISGTTVQGLAKVTGFKATTTMDAVKLSWNKVSGADGYWVYRAKPEGGWTKIKTTSSLSYTDGSREAATEYKYAVKAYKKVNGKEIYGEYPTLTVATRPAKLTGLKLSSITADTAALEWNAVEGASGYYVYYRKPGDSEWIRKDITKTSHTFSGLNGGTKYEFAAKAYKTAGGVKYVGEYPTITGTTAEKEPEEKLVLYITTEDVNYRAAPGLTGEKRGVIPNGTTVQVVDGFSQEADGIVWFKFKYNGEFYYMSSDYLRLPDEGEIPDGTEVLKQYVTTDNVNYRTEPSVNGGFKGTLEAGMVIDVVEGYSKTADNIVWYKFKLNNSYYFVASHYLKEFEEGDVSVIRAEASVPQIRTLFLTGYAGGTWESSDESIATVKGGFVYGAKEGTAEISCTSGMNKKIWTVKVTAADPVKLAYVGPNIASVGKDVTFVAITDASRNAVKFEVNGKTKVVTDYTTETTKASDGFPGTTSRIWKYTTTIDKAGAYTAKIYSAKKKDGSDMSSIYYTTEAYVVSTQDAATTSLDTRRMSDEGLKVIASWESYIPIVYLDPLTSTVVPTVGYGHTFAAGDTFYNNLTETEAWALLCDVVNKNGYTTQVNKFIEMNKIKANQAQFDAMVSFSYNCGSGWWNGTSEFDLRMFLLNSVNPDSVQKKITAGETVTGRTVLPTQVYSSQKQTGTGTKTLAAGTSVTITEATWDSTNKAAWYKVKSGNVTGYVSASYVTITSHSFEKDMNYMDAVTFGSEMLCWHHAGGNCYAGLVYRRLGESKLFSFGKYSAAMNDSSEKNVNTYGYLLPNCISTKNWLK